MIVVVGSVNLDLVASVDRLPEEGETVLATSHQWADGGKGANQAVAASRLGADVTFVGAVGSDETSRAMIGRLAAEGIDVSAVKEMDGESYGLAVVTVNSDGDNVIVVSPGANNAIALDETARALVASADVVLLQLEIPVDIVAEAARLAEGTVILNAAPAARLSEDLLADVDVLIVNEHEGSIAVRGGYTDSNTDVITTLGERGCSVVVNGDRTAIEAPKVPTVDTTGAGDTFCGAFAYEVDRGTSTIDAARTATLAGSLATTALGARSAMPAMKDVDQLLRDILTLEEGL